MRPLVAVTGATGFVGHAVVFELVSSGLNVRAAVRTVDSSSPLPVSDITYLALEDVDSHTNWSATLTGVDCVIHCAARAHVMHETDADALAAYRAVNTQGTRRLAEHAVAAGVRRLVFLSSVKVNGETTDGLPRPFGARNDGGGSPPAAGPGLAASASFARDHVAPEDAYGVSKWEAEQALWEISAKTGLEVVVVRPPLVYGSGAKGNFARLLKLVRSGVPLPLGSVQNKRSLIGLDNLVDLLIRCIDHPAVAGQTFLVSDGEDLSTPDLLRHMAAAMGRSARLFSVPVSLLRLAGSALGKRAEIDRLVGSLQIDSSQIRQVLGWAPPVSVEEGIRRMVKGA